MSIAALSTLKRLTEVESATTTSPSLAPMSLAILSAICCESEIHPALFQLRGPWEVRGAVHEIAGWPEGRLAVLVLNDGALDNPAVRYYLAVPYEEGDWRLELVLVNADDLGEEVRVLSDAEQGMLSAELASIFPLAG